MIFRVLDSNFAHLHGIVLLLERLDVLLLLGRQESFAVQLLLGVPQLVTELVVRGLEGLLLEVEGFDVLGLFLKGEREVLCKQV